ncbi:hypothetical protein SAMN05421493_101265 [Pseudobutyrivibrio sp. 49]|uniref:VirB6/TrbL-like conjugal transfer protein, CD1112 family n=1 Tax=Pseudobutyrivibrio sp. 49 TaxID=1855344 RepID=UPI000883E35E|nr:CD0415/CD1112 family protein [Pseudobutyrivibrio sp. 49]SDH30720.1 hypothetical protein SAMN05421493_101265 [Pseudobutyrivibrio sp. 49]
MDLIFDAMADYVKSKLIDGVMWVLTGLFDSVNDEVAKVAGQVSTGPADFVPGVYPLIKSTSETALLPIAGIIMTFIACYELIQLVVAHNNLANFETWIFIKWLLKTSVAVLAITHCFDFTMAVFDVTGHVCQDAGSFITHSTAVTGPQLAQLRSTLESMGIGEILPIYAEITVLGAGFKILSLIIFVVIYGRMIEIYLLVSMAPIPFSTFGNKEQSHIGQNYVRSLLAIGFQGFLILIVVGIYAVLIQNITISDDIVGTIWGIMGYNILLVFSLFKTGTLSKRVFSAQ